MLIINRVKAAVFSDNGKYIVDENLYPGLNFIASEQNTTGKTSTIDIVYYCLGFEQIIGGVGDKTMTSVYKSLLDDGDDQRIVLESGCYLEISNGSEIITIYRSVRSSTRDSHLVTVYYCALDDINEPSTIHDDMYVNLPDAAVSKKGFHSYLAQFLHLDIPDVPSSGGRSRKLYLQLIFSAMFIEQKHGWGGIFAGMPYLGINEQKKRVVEFILNLDTLENEKKRISLRQTESDIEREWSGLLSDLQKAANRQNCILRNAPASPGLFNEEQLNAISLFKVTDVRETLISDYILELMKQHEALSVRKPKIVDNFESLQEELNQTEKDIIALESRRNQIVSLLSAEKKSISSLSEELEIVKQDIKNNKDVEKLQKLGSEADVEFLGLECPLCRQAINDALIDSHVPGSVMSVDDNIRHLEAQKELLIFSVASKKGNYEYLQSLLGDIEERLLALRRLAKSLRSDIFSVDDEASEAIVYKRVEIENTKASIEDLNDELDNARKKLMDLVERWKECLLEKSSLPVDYYTEDDKAKLDYFNRMFRSNLKRYGYRSVADIDRIKISEENYQPTIEEFDLRFDSSASDCIRSIWAYTIALLQTSIEYNGNHPGVVIFDEPDQHSIVSDDLKEFLNSILELDNSSQAIIGITLKGDEICKAVGETNPKTMILLKEKAFSKRS